MNRRMTIGLSLLTTAGLALAGCSAPEGADSQLRLGTFAVGDYNPLSGHSVDGASPFYEGLLKPGYDEGDGAAPDLEAGLATELPEVSGDYKTFIVKLRDDVKFSDGSEFDSADVKATYEAIMDPGTASEVADSFRMLKSVVTPDAHTVVFNLKDSTLDFESRLTLGILPEEQVEAGTPAAEWSVNTKPVGTGPYELSSLESNTAVIEAREDYWDGEPGVKKVTYQAFDDDAALVDALKNGKIDGTQVSPRVAESLASDGRELVTARTADWRGITLPSRNSFTNDPQVRLAMNIGVDRDKMVKDVFAGHGQVAHTPAGSFNGGAFNPDATFDHDVDQAKKILDDAGWKEGSDGIREKGGERAELTIMYDGGDTLRADMAAEIKEQLQPLGIEVTTKGTDWDEIMPNIASVGVVYAGGDRLGDNDHQFRAPLHTKTESSSEFDNPANIEVPGADELLDKAATATDQDEADELYRKVQELYIEQPSYLIMAFYDHTYIDAATDWKKPGVHFEPHAHGTDWGPWASLAEWTEK